MAESHVSTGIMGLKPPERMCAMSAEEYKRFKQRFAIYRTASGASEKSGAVQVALLLHCMGEQAIELFQTFDLTDEEKDDYKKVIERFDIHFIPLKNESVASHIFFTRVQKINENFDSYLTELKKLAKDCDFGTLQERLIRDRIVAGIRDSKLKDRLLRECDLTLEKAIKICKAAELATERLKEMDEEKDSGSTSVDKISKGKQKKYEDRREDHNQKKYKNETRKFNREDRKYNNEERKFKKEDKIDCTRCGFQHTKSNCPAYGKTCMICKKIGHFARKCNRNKQWLKTVYTEEDSTEDELYLNKVESIQVNSVDIWSEKVQFIDFNNKELSFKLESVGGTGIGQ